MALAVAMIFGVIAFAFGKKRARETERESLKPPPGDTPGVAIETIQESFTESLKSTEKKLKGEDPAGDLADGGNARERR